MSRTARGAGKEKPKLHQPPQPIISPDIVPGKFTEHDWSLMVEKDNAEDFIHDFLDEILSITMTRLYKLYIKKQLVPYTVHRTANEMMRIVRWKFVDRDEGETKELYEKFWIQDKEPQIGQTDSWARGSVPVSSKKPPEIRIDKEMPPPPVEKPKSIPKKKSSKVKEKPVPEKTEAEIIKEQLAQRKARHARYRLPRMKPKPRPLPQPLQPADSTPSGVSEKLPLISSSQSLPRRDSKARRYSRQSVAQPTFAKLNPEDFPSHRVTLKFQIVNPSTEIARSGSLRKSLQLARGMFINHQKSRSSADSLPLDHEGRLVRTRRVIPIECPPSVLETITVVPGVTVLEGGRTKKLTKRPLTDHLDLNLASVHPIASKPEERSFSVSNLLDQDGPIVRPLSSLTTLPPITNNTPPSSDSHSPT